jgi:hypothetical protein
VPGRGRDNTLQGTAMKPNNSVQATPVYALLLLQSQRLGAPDDNRWNEQ